MAMYIREMNNLTNKVNLKNVGENKKIIKQKLKY